MRPLALTCGEPGGIAGEITLAAWQALALKPETAFFVIADAEHLSQLSDSSVPIETIEKPADAAAVFGKALPVLHHPLEAPVKAGSALPVHAGAVIGSIDRAVELVLEGKAGAVVTNPIQKESLYQAGFRYQGHTDYLASLVRNAGFDAEPVMMLSSGDFRTVPVTVHIALREVFSSLTVERIISQTKATATGLREWFGISNPRIAVTGLNPHAGEGGAMGNEEINIISPAVETMKAEGLDVFGPVPADTIFHEEARATYDAVMGMYHDQALIPVKTIGFHDGVNTTLGLPFARTSPDHGTALSLAGTGKANASSLVAALRQAAAMVAHKKRTSR